MSSRLSAGFLLHSDAASTLSGGGDGGTPALSPVQSLAVTGLNLLSQSQAAATVSSRNNRFSILWVLRVNSDPGLWTAEPSCGQMM